jgi:hypothetical protein
MRFAIALLVAAFLCQAFAPWARADVPPTDDLTALCITALSENKEEAGPAIVSLRAAGPAGLEALISTYHAAINRHHQDPARNEPMWDRLSLALDTVAAQKDAWAAGLYWYTDLDQAKRVAAKTGKPILSLRLLGTLDTEFSCANSRFFRTALYPDTEVGKFLRENFVLHWQSHRPVPKLTIDFGDGRKIERTITGNSVHYVLAPDGRVIDVIPGLYGPTAFLRAIVDAHSMAVAYKRADFGDILMTYHTARLSYIRKLWDADLKSVGLSATIAGSELVQSQTVKGRAPTAMAGTRITAAKSAAETVTVAALAPDRAALAAGTDDAAWAKIGALHAADGKLDAGSRAVILSKAGDAVAANNRTFAKRRVEDPVTRLVRNFERSVAEDSVRNEYLLHSQIHEWFVKGQAPANLDDLNEKVYAQLFLMPKSDPFLGLVPADTYTGLPADATAVSGAAR